MFKLFLAVPGEFHSCPVDVDYPAFEVGSDDDVISSFSKLPVFRFTFPDFFFGQFPVGDIGKELEADHPSIRPFYGSAV